MNDRVTIELEWEQIDAIVIQELKEIVRACQENIDSYQSKDRKYIAIFSTNKEEDIAMLHKHINAANLLLKYYGCEVIEEGVINE